MISRDYLLPKIRDEIGLADQDLVLPEKVVQRLIEDYTAEAGLRKLKEMLYDIVREANRRGIKGDLDAPYHITDPIASDMLKRRNPIIHDKIHDKPLVGTMNGLYANSTGLGGITKIQAIKCYSKTHLQLRLTATRVIS